MPTGVLIPVHGFAPFLAEALDSVLAQKPDRVVVIDDGSDPAVALHPDHAGAVTLVRLDPPARGPAPARGAGLTALPAAVDLIALCDADDAWEPGKLAAQAAALAAHPQAGLCFGRARVVGADGRPTGERWDEPAPGIHAAAEFALALYGANPIPTSSVVLRRDALAQAGGFEGPVSVAEDWELWLRMARAGSDALCVPQATVRYRRHGAGLTADVARLAHAQHVVHERHGGLVDAPTRARALAADQRAAARGYARAGDHAEARNALRSAAEHARPSARDRALALMLALPGARALAARRDPYRG